MTRFVPAVAVRDDVMHSRSGQSRNPDVMKLTTGGAANHAPPRYPARRSCSEAWCYHPASLGVATGEIAAEPPSLVADTFAVYSKSRPTDVFQRREKRT